MTAGVAEYTALRFEASDGVATITLDRPAVLNALDRQLKAELARAIRQAAADASVRAVVLTGAGRAFCAGQDLGERVDPAAGPLGAEVRERYNPLILSMRRLEKPLVAAVNGTAAGAGVALVLACDLRLAAEGASFILAFGRIGLVPDSGTSWFLPRLVGAARAAELLLVGDPVGAAEAERIGLVNRVVPADRLLDEAHELASRLAAGAPLAMGLTKRALNRSAEATLEESLEYEAGLQSIAGRSRDHAEGLAAFREKRAPRFKGE